MVRKVADRVASRYVTTMRVAARALAAMDMPKPRSIYDRLPDNIQPFGWSSPAPLASGQTPAPWRVAHADRARDLLKKMFPSFKDAYVDYGDGAFHGREQLWIGLRENRNVQEHANRIQELSDGLSEAGFKTRLESHGPRMVLHLVDDLPKNVLKAS